MQTFSDVALGAYCLRKLHYRRHGTREVSVESTDGRDLATRYSELLDTSISGQRLGTDPDTVAANLRRARNRFPAAWPPLLDPPATDRVVAGADCRGRLAKILDTEPPAPTLVSSGEPPDNGVWHPHTVKAVAAAKALGSEVGRDVDWVFFEYPRYGVVRRIAITGPRVAAYRRILDAVRHLGNPPARTDNTRKCRSCEYRQECGVESRSLLSLLS